MWGMVKTPRQLHSKPLGPGCDRNKNYLCRGEGGGEGYASPIVLHDVTPI